MLFLDRPAARGQQLNALIKALKLALPRHLVGMPYSMHLHPSASHHGLQMVDYLSWALYVKWERAELRPHALVQRLIRGEFEVYRDAIEWY